MRSLYDFYPPKPEIIYLKDYIYGPTPEFRLSGRYQSIVKGQGATLDDPMILYVRDITKPEDAHTLSVDRRQIAVSVVGHDGTVFPTDGKTVWPVACSH